MRFRRNPLPLPLKKLLPLVVVLVHLVTGFAYAEAPRQLRVMTFNSWHEWTHIDGGFSKARKTILAADVDIIGLQESSPAVAQRMADELGWHRAEAGTGSVQILSRYPIEETFTSDGLTSDRFIAARIQVSQEPPLDVLFCDTHLDYEYYGPYAAYVSGASPEDVLAENAKSQRVPQIRAVLETMKPWIETSDTTPVILTGDFNVPSHLDWTAATATSHGGVGPVPWPESLLVERAGLRDSFRVAHPDPAATPGNTWSTIHKEDEPQDRIDFIYFAGNRLNVVDSRLYATDVEVTIGKWGTDETPVRANSWPSDHFAVITTFELR